MRTLRTIRIGQFLLGAMLLAAAAHAAQRTAEMPRLENAKVETRREARVDRLQRRSNCRRAQRLLRQLS